MVIAGVAGVSEGGARVAFEDPGHPDHRAGLALAGIEAVPVPVDERGVELEALEASGAGAVVLTPAHQSPTGALLAPERRQALVAWAAENDATLIEDDYDEGRHRVDRGPAESRGRGVALRELRRAQRGRCAFGRPISHDEQDRGDEQSQPHGPEGRHVEGDRHRRQREQEPHRNGAAPVGPGRQDRRAAMAATSHPALPTVSNAVMIWLSM